MQVEVANRVEPLQVSVPTWKPVGTTRLPRLTRAVLLLVTETVCNGLGTPTGWSPKASEAGLRVNGEIPVPLSDRMRELLMGSVATTVALPEELPRLVGENWSMKVQVPSGATTLKQ